MALRRGSTLEPRLSPPESELGGKLLGPPVELLQVDLVIEAADVVDVVGVAVMHEEKVPLLSESVDLLPVYLAHVHAVLDLDALDVVDVLPAVFRVRQEAEQVVAGQVKLYNVQPSGIDLLARDKGKRLVRKVLLDQLYEEA